MRCKAVAEVNGFSVLFCSFKKGDVISNRLTHVRAREGLFEERSFSHVGNQQGTLAPDGSWALPGDRCNLVVPQ